MLLLGSFCRLQRMNPNLFPWINSQDSYGFLFSNGSFWKFHVIVAQNNGKEMYKKKSAARAKLLFC